MEASPGTGAATRRRINPGRRQGAEVSPLELFFDLVFVLAITQCTQLMADNPTWAGLGQGLLVLALLWWSWAAYAWLTSVLDPDDGAVRGVIFAAMAALLIASICVPATFDDLALPFVAAYGVVRFAHIASFWLASRDEPDLRRSVLGITGGTSVCIALLAVGALFDGWVQASHLGLRTRARPRRGLHLRRRRLAAPARPLRRAAPADRADRAGRVDRRDRGRRRGLARCRHRRRGRRRDGARPPPCGGSTSTSSRSSRPGASSRPSRARFRTRLARDSYSYIHYVLVAGIVLTALGPEEGDRRRRGPAQDRPRVRAAGRRRRLPARASCSSACATIGASTRTGSLIGLLLVAAVPLATEVPALAAVGGVAAVHVGDGRLGDAQLRRGAKEAASRGRRRRRGRS